MSLSFECLLESSLVIEARRMQMALLYHIALSTVLVVDMTTEEVHGWQLQLITAGIAVFLVEVLAGPLHPLDVLAHGLNVLCHLLDALFLNLLLAVGRPFQIGPDHLLLLLKLLHQEVLNNLKFPVSRGPKNLEHQQRRQNLILANVLKRPLNVLVAHALVVLELSEVGKCLDPQVRILLCSVFLAIGQGLTDAWVFAPLEHFLSLPVVDVKGKQLLAQVQLLAAVAHSVVVLVNLEQKQDVVLVHFVRRLVGFQEVVD